MSQRGGGELLGRVLEARLPLSTGTLRELLVAELERRSRAEIALETARERALELVHAVNVYQLLVEHISGCARCTMSRFGCGARVELAARVKTHVERAAALAK